LLESAFTGALWPSETAWRFELELVQTGDFSATDVLTVRGLPVPATNQVTQLNQEHQLAGQPLRLLSLLGTRAFPLRRGYVRIKLDTHGDMTQQHLGVPVGGYLKLQVDARGAAVGQRVTLAAVTDEQGRPVTIDDQPSQSGTKLDYLLEAAPDARSLTLRFVRQESRLVSFVARPNQVGLPTGR
jgi:acyl-coenzyme A thioesterase PaaI-like protein